MIVNPVYAEDENLAMSLTINQYRPPELLDLIQTTNQQFIQTIQHYSEAFANKVSQMANYFNNNPLIEKIKNRLTRSEVILSDSAVHRVTPINIFNPSMTMRRYIMAYPRAYTLYRKDRISGYDDTWIDSEPYFPARWRTDYLKVMDGIMQYHQDDGKGFTEHLVGRENELSFLEQTIIREAWEVFDELMSKDIDPTDLENYNKGGESV